MPVDWDVACVGLPDEKPAWPTRFVHARSAWDALTMGVAAALFVGTDTGVATARELLHLPSIYCISRFWLEHPMTKYGYWPESMARRTRSAFAFSEEDLAAAMRRFVTTGALVG